MLGTALIVVFRPQAVDAYPRAGLVYYPFLPTAKEPPASIFEAGEVLEFQQKDLAKAIVVFRELSHSKDPAIRAGALLRLGRNLRKAQQSRDALDAYGELEHMDGTSIGGLPAELLARHERCSLLDELKRTTELKREAGALYADLHNGRWKLARGVYRFYAQEASRWYTPDAELQAHAQDAAATAAAVELLWEEWQRIRRGEGIAAGHRSLWILGRPVLLVWQTNSDRLVALVAGPHYLEQQWLSVLQPVMDRQGVRLALTDAEGHPILAQFSASSRQAVRSSAETQLPWTLHVVEPRSPGGVDSARESAPSAAVGVHFGSGICIGGQLLYRTGRDARARSRAAPVRLRFGCLARISDTLGLASSTERTVE